MVKENMYKYYIENVQVGILIFVNDKKETFWLVHLK